ncbi:MAG: amino acid adenylation domain-containing protein [Lentisphaeraceae bacterium]|nr:amino acid adenylation domain-containing protein [Lentisphaeraceae bacterium]
MLIYQEVEDFVESLAARQIKLTSNGEKLKCIISGEHKLQAEERDYIRENKIDIIDYLQSSAVSKALQDIETFYALSPLQEGILFHAIHSPESNQHCAQLNWSLQGEMNLTAFEQAWSELILKHAIYRTAFKWEGLDEAVQIVYKKVKVPFVFHDARKELEPSRYFQKEKEQDALKPFDLSKACAIRITVIQTADDRYEVLWNYHHILTDGWCTPRVIGEVLQRYVAAAEGLEFSERNIPSYESYIRYLRSLDKQVMKDFWREHLKGFTEANVLSTAKPTDRHKDIRAALYDLELSGELTSQCTALTQSRQVPLNALVQLAWAKVLAVYSGRDEVIMGTVVSGRPAELDGVEEILGLFMNSLPLRFTLGNDSVADALQRLQQELVEVNANSALSLTEINEQSEIEKGTALFENLFIFENLPLEESLKKQQLKNLQLLDVEYQQKGNFPLMMKVFCSDRLSVEFSYDQDKYDHSDIVQLGAHLKVALEAFIDDEHQLLTKVSLLSAEESQQILIENNKTSHTYPADKTVLDLFEEQVVKAPDAIALTFAGEHLTYGELNERADSLAGKLAVELKDVEGDRLVGLYTERSLEMLIGIWGIMKAGAAYIPLDIDWPLGRINKVIETSGLNTVLTQQIYEGHLSSSPANIYTLDGKWINEKPAEEIALVRPQMTDLIYVIFTSGSTGEPKGVMLEHGGILNQINWLSDYYGFKADDVHLQKTPYTFDISILEFFPPIISGGRLVIAKPQGHKENAYLADLIEREKVSLIHFVPSMLQSFVSSLEDGDFEAETLKSLRLAFACGEALPSALAHDFARLSPHTKLHNLYGPAEASADVSFFDCADIVGDGVVSIGKPMWNTKLYILDDNLQPCLAGVIGELHISGICLARGYMQRQDLTDERFIENPFTDEVSYERLYKTGDLVRLEKDGNITFMGRKDFQVKLRGLRIELGEIEALLNAHEDIIQAVAEVRSEQLIVFYQGKDEANEETLKAYLADLLPVYMVPEHFVFVEEFAKTVSGKINRLALPEVGGLTQEYVAPEGELEEHLASIWQALLSVEKVARFDDFFKLGGHSLKVTRLCSQIRKNIQVEVPLKKVFEKPVLADLAEFISHQQKAAAYEAIPQVDHSQAQVLSHFQQRLWLTEKLHDGPGSSYNMPLQLKLTGALGTVEVESALKMLIERHASLRTRFVEDGEDVKQLIDANLDFTLTCQDISYNDLEGVLKADASTVFDLANDLLYRVKLYRLSAQEHVLSFVQHHIISDAWSIGILAHEFFEIFNANRENRQPQLEVLPCQYIDYAVWQKGQLQGEELEKKLSFWKDTLKGSEALNLGGLVQKNKASKKVAVAELTLGTKISRGINKLCQKEQVSLFMLMNASLNLVLWRYSGKKDILLTSPVANRLHPDLERVIGFFVNTLTLRSQISGKQKFNQYLQEVKQFSLAAFENQDVAFEQILQELELSAEESNSLFNEVRLVVNEKAELGEGFKSDLEIEALETQRGDAKFALLINVSRREKVTLNFQYDEGLFNGEFMFGMLQSWQEVLEYFIAQPNKTLNELSLTEQGSASFNDSDLDYDRSQTIVDRIAAWAVKTPQQTAIRFEDESLTYAEFNERADELAKYISQQLTGPEPLVALCLEPSVEMPLAMLAALKAGAAYIPLDPASPLERLAGIVDDAQPQLIISSSVILKENQLQLNDHTLLLIDEEREPLNDVELAEISPQNAAYIIYTSGSTGKPKGVVVEHTSLVNYSHWLGTYLDESWQNIDCSLSFAFDASLTTSLASLMLGRTVSFCSKETKLDPVAYAEYMAAHEINFTKLTPSYFNAIVDEMCSHEHPHLKCIMQGGEALSVSHSRQWLEAGTDRQMINHYGPTETTVGASHQIFDLSCIEEFGDSVPIGKVRCNSRYYVLDEDLLECPIGSEGELYIGGEGLARGYLGREDLSAERFIENPYVTAEEKAAGRNLRLYKTGDVVRRLGNGAISYVGRSDFQVKIRGYRIELGEIENVIKEFDGINDCVVLVVDGELRAFCQTELESFEELQNSLNRSLPDYMHPAHFISLEKIPLTVNGKVDRKSLVEINVDRSKRVGATEATSENEIRLLAIWQEVLKRDEIGIHDNFFSLGGDSIMTIQVIARAKKGGLKIRPKQLFENPTIAALAALPQTSSKGKVEQEVKGELALLPAQVRFFEKNYVNAAHYNQSLLIRSKGTLDHQKLQTAFRALVNYHDGLRVFFRQEHDQWRAYYEEKNTFKFPCQKVEVKTPEELTVLATEAQASLSLENKELLRVIHFCGLDDARDRVMIVMHHLLTDGVSWRAMIEDLQELYECKPLAEKSLSVQSWMKTTKQYLQRQQDSHWDFWLNSPQNGKVLENTDVAEVTVNDLASQTSRLNKEDTMSLLEDVNQAYQTNINDILLTALLLAFKQQFDCDNLQLDLEGHGRETALGDVDISRTASWFTSIYPISLSLPDESVSQESILVQSLIATKDYLRQLPDKGAAYGYMRYCSDDERALELAEKSASQVCFNYFGIIDAGQSESSLFELAREDKGAGMSPENQAKYLIEINASIINSTLGINTSYSQSHFSAGQIEGLANSYVYYLKQLIEHCRQQDGTSYTVSDFAVDLSQQELESISFDEDEFSSDDEMEVEDL